MGIKNIVIAFLHSLKNKAHEKRVYEIARSMDFEQIILSSDFPIPKFILRSETAIIDSYLSPTIKSFSKHIQNFFPNVPLFFMQSLGGLVVRLFSRSNSLLSGPAGEVIGAVKIIVLWIQKSIGFDMGGTSTMFSLCGHWKERTNTLSPI